MASLLLLLAVSSFAIGDDRFALAVGPHDTLVIFAPNGTQVAELSVPTISKPIKIGDTSFQVSYGRDADDLLTAILTPDPTAPQSLHFYALKKTIDTDNQAVVTLTFSRALDRVTVDPGYLGLVQVDSHSLRRHELTDENEEAPPVQPEAPLVARVTPELAPREATASETSAGSPPPFEQITKPINPPPWTVESQARASAPPPAATQKAPVTEQSAPPAPPTAPSPAPLPASASSTESSAEEYADQGTHPGTYKPTGTIPGIPLEVPMATKAEVTRFYWSEPITPPDGHPPPIAIDEMKLVDVQGTVTVKMPDGTTKPGENGMVIPSGTSVLTTNSASAAVFIGGVDSARLLPDTDVSITHDLDGEIRHTKVDLRDGTVFSRVGRRAGEREDYSVSTPEGVAAARGTEYADNRRKDDSGRYHHYVFVLKGIVALLVNGQAFGMITGNGATEVGTGSVPPAQDERIVLMEILEILQPFNTYTNEILQKLNGGSGELTAQELQFYNRQLGQSLYLVDEFNRLIVGPNGLPTPYTYLTPGQLNGLTPSVLFQKFGYPTTTNMTPW